MRSAHLRLDPGVLDARSSGAGIAARHLAAGQAQGEQEAFSKRDQNRQAMRQSIIRAAQTLVAEKGYGNFTANDVAHAAGCSRRTFFNYFPTLPAAIMEPSYSLNDAVAQHFASQPADVPLPDLLMGLLTIFDGNDTQLETIIRMNSLADRYPEIQRYDLQGWLRFAEVLEESLHARFPGLEPLVLKCLVNSVSSASRIACDEASRLHAEDPGADLGAVLRDTAYTFIMISLDGLAAHLPALSEPASSAGSDSPTPDPEG